MKQKRIEIFIYSTIGVAVMFLIIVLINVIAGVFKVRVDMTEHQIFSLADGTKRILKNLDAPVEIRLYASEGGSAMPSTWRTYAQNVKDLLEEFKVAAKGKIDIRKFDPQPDSDEEDLANLDGIQPQVNPSNGDNFYLGIAISQDPVKVALPVVPPDRQELLEYDLARAISRVTNTNKPVVGIMTALPMFGQPPNPMMMRMGQQPQQPWVVVSELQNDFTVRQVPMDSDKIDEDIKVLMVVHPKDIKDKAEYAIDQFLLHGGKLIALLDAKSLVDRPQDNNNPMAAMMGGGPSNLEKLLKAWGLKFETTQVVADRIFSKEVSFQRGAKAQAAPALLFLNEKAIDRDDVATSQIDNLLLPFAGSFSGTPAKGLTETVLVHSSEESELTDPMTAQFSGPKVLDDFKPSGKEFQLAVRLQGKFKTAFPDGKPAESTDKTADKKEENKKDETQKQDGSLKESQKESVVVLFGDSDFIYDNFCVRIIPLFNVAQPLNGNLTLVQNVVEQLAGDINLIGARSRASVNRPFTVVSEMQAQANKRFQDEIKKLEEEKSEAERRLAELQTKKDPGQQQYILSKEQQEEIQKFRDKQAQANRRLREVKKDLSKDIKSLENRLKWANIAGMPVVITLAGLALAFFRKQRTRAK
jgi:gliding motility-associatede transport system auxiliary component